MSTDNRQLLRTGAWMNGFKDDLFNELSACENLCFEFNALPPGEKPRREQLLRKIIGHIGCNFTIHSPFRCDFGSNIHIGDNFVANYNLTILDEATVTIGDNVFIGPNTGLYTVKHAFLADQRNAGIMQALPITIENDVWIAANTIILPGVTIGHESIIGAGSVVTKSIPPRVLAIGNPCKVIRPIDESDRVRPATNSSCT